MEHRTYPEFQHETGDFDRDVLRTPDIDYFCSASAWSVSAAEALMPERDSWIYRFGEQWIALARGISMDGLRYLQPLEAAWGLSCPLIGPNHKDIVKATIGLVMERQEDWDVLLLTGIPSGSKLFHECMKGFAHHWQVGLGEPTHRNQAILDGGIDDYLGRRSTSFRRNLRRVLRRARVENIQFEKAHQQEPGALFRRILAVEQKSWKGLSGSGMISLDMKTFYQRMVHRLAAAGRLRVWFARKAMTDIAYILGGVFGNTYRGLQFSYDHAFANLGLGNLCQHHQLLELCDEGIGLYDLGAQMAYKESWGDHLKTTAALWVYSPRFRFNTI